ncbi:hypothetical protein [Chitinophaga nivalis]|uniref:Copper chaperone n=1 Tax=Chitinophaga nivalis TaxID=2991709 RepID=A0ABT3IGS9_9BACT|nr:hypothetical protein [Chitinophaga nivalis]MCW3467298.1 hypothetical protein [Chitinophaga nivalis]MCW3483010.1 hypothetical protein [Chitinophaga nivalis]
MEIPAHILIFKTNIATPHDLQKVKPVLDTQQQIIQWTIDQTDVDCVLRVVSHHFSYNSIIHLITETGYACMELPD